MSTSAWPLLLDQLESTTGFQPHETSDGVTACCPAHGDSNPSLSAKLCEDGRILLYCFAGCEVRDILRPLEMNLGDLMPDRRGSSGTAASGTDRRQTDERPVLPADLSTGNIEEHAGLASLRHVRLYAVQAAVERGLIGFGTHRDARCWFVLDATGQNIQARRLDGMRFGEMKALTLKNSKASWPIGITAARPHQSIALVEGGPDLLAALSLAWEEELDEFVAPVAMLGAAHKIPDNALPYFKGKRVRIYPHLDDAGRKAAVVWERQLRRAGADARSVSLAGIRMDSGQEAKDLNDVCRMSLADFARDRTLWNLFAFAGEAFHD